MAERKDNRSSTGRQNIPKDPWRITFSHAATTDGKKSRKTPTAEVPTINEEVPWPCLIFLCSARQCVTANKRMATIGGANTHSRPDRLSFVTSFTLSNDTHCFWTHSYANRPSTWHRLALLFPFFRVRLSSSRSCLCLSAPRRVTRPFSSALPSFRRYHRASRFFFQRCSYRRDGWIRFVRIKRPNDDRANLAGNEWWIAKSVFVLRGTENPCRRFDPELALQ